eukprot:8659257-Pyramimonas_sp.AAC.1
MLQPYSERRPVSSSKTPPTSKLSSTKPSAPPQAVGAGQNLSTGPPGSKRSPFRPRLSTAAAA